MALTIDYDNDLIQYIDVDFSGRKSFETVYAKQYDDKARFIIATVWRDGEEYTIPTGTTAMFCTTKPDMHYVADSKNCEIINNKIVYQIAYQATTKDGNFPAEFRLYEAGTEKAYSTPRFNMSVEKSALLDGTIESTDEFNVLTRLILDATQALADMSTALNNVETATTNAETATTNMIDLNQKVTEDENERINNENTRLINDETRPLYFYLTQAEYDALPQADKDNPKYIYEITDDDGLFPSQLQQLIDDAQAATDAANQAASGVLPNFGTVGTYNKVTTDSKGRIQGGTLETTLAGLGINDAYTKTEIDIEKLSKNGDSSNNTVTFTEAAEDLDILTGETHTTLFSKIKKRLANILLSLANKFDKANVANNLFTTAEGLALDARQGKILNDSITTTNNNFSSQDASSLFVNGYSTLTAPATLSKSGKVVLLSMYLVKIGTDVIDTLIMTLPPEYRPSTTRYCNIPVTNGGALDEMPYTIRVTIWNDGSVFLAHTYTHKSTHPYIMGTLVFSI